MIDVQAGRGLGGRARGRRGGRRGRGRDRAPDRDHMDVSGVMQLWDS